MEAYKAIIPELLFLIPLFWGLFANKLPGKDRGAAFVGFIVAAVSVSLVVLSTPAQEGLFGGLLIFDDLSKFVRIAVASLAGIWMLWVAGKSGTRTREAVAAASLITIGSMFMASTQELITLLVCLELATLPGYILIGYKRNNRLSLEGALKYFLLSMTTSLVMLYGFSFLYGVSGVTRFAGLTSAGGLLPTIATILVFVGLFAKLALAPFHFWAPDAYEGTDSWLVAFVSSVPKIAAFLVFIRLAISLFPGTTEIILFTTLVAVASIVLGNLSALGQGDIRRIMAYSGVAQMGYALIGILSRSDLGIIAAIFFVVCYSIASMGVLLSVGNQDPSLRSLAGFGQKHPWMAGSAAVMLLSAIGIPPLAGFMGKFYLFTAAIEQGLLWLVVIAVIGSIVSAAYYLRVIKAMFFDKAEVPAQPATAPVKAGDVGAKANEAEDAEAALEHSLEEEGIPALAEKPAAEDATRVAPASGVAVVACVAATVALGILTYQLFTTLFLYH